MTKPPTETAYGRLSIGGLYPRAGIVYPSIKTVLAGPATVDVLNGIANGTCVGGMLNEVELRYAFGPGA